MATAPALTEQQLEEERKRRQSDEWFAGYNPPGSDRSANTANISQVQTQDVEQMPTLDRNWAVAQGAGIDASLEGRGNDQEYLEQYYRNSANSAYAPILEGKGGYTDAEKGQIVRSDELKALDYNPQMTEDLQLTADEQAAMKGDPDKATQWFDPAWNDQIVTDQTARTREAVADTSTNLRDTIDPAALRMNDSVAGDVRAGIDATGANVREAIDRDRMTVSDDFVKGYRMSPEQQQALVDQAGRQVGGQTRAAIGDLEQAAAASGNASPLAVGAARSRLENASAANAADAMTNARIAADRERADREAGIEDRRLSAESGYAGLKSSAELDLGKTGTDAALQTEAMRLAAEQELSKNRQGVEGAIGDARLQNEADIGDKTLAMAQWNQQEGNKVTTQADDRKAERAGTVATNRQGVTQAGQQEQWNRGTGISDRLSGQNTQVADARLETEKEARGFLSGQNAQASENVNTANDQRIQNYGTQAGAMGQATGTAAQYDLGRRGQSFGTAFKTSLGSTLGKTLGGGSK